MSETKQIDLFSQAPVALPGLTYVPDFLSQAEEADLVARIDAAEWLPVIKRRVQHYGWRYDYKARKVDPSMQLGPLPDWAANLAGRLAAERRTPQRADQVIVNEYVGAQGISKHVDCVPCFEDGIATISLLESWEMTFRKGDLKIARLLERRSVAVFSGEARYEWQHEIPSRQREPHGLQRARRISITFRKVRTAAAPVH